ncbi:hypothetical protein AB0G60_02705 [Streptomyces angustmyceticus]|uniref:Uncharacterized protein n=1 Tax=Streptomyces angustmyceticus TaxID=285578 RepID=A0A5J4L0I6_9ACTN|nr:hypothetical protein [Streptomyces angustmyceticus]UAL65574.1 hypothetical protein K7396_02680 [Streptomyces angustmyceticus]GES27907.1 hypothetical protein San01_03940 [Streptomyces angustmyceticus]
MTTATLDPASLDQAAARIVPTLTAPERDAWADITAGYSRDLVSKTTAELVDEALRSLPQHGTRPAIDVKLPGRIARALPDWAHRTRADLSHKPSAQLAVAAEILRKWGWQNKPHHLRDGRGRRCICGAICTTVAGLGVGTIGSAHQAAGYVLAELRGRGWNALIGDWNQGVCRTPEQAIELVNAGQRRALAAGR